MATTGTRVKDVTVVMCLLVIIAGSVTVEVRARSRRAAAKPGLVETGGTEGAEIVRTGAGAGICSGPA